MLQLMKENAGRIGSAIVLLMAFGISAIASKQVSEHDKAVTAHIPQFEIIAKSIRKNRTDIDILTERNEQRYRQVQRSLEKQEKADIRINDKLDKILEKL